MARNDSAPMCSRATAAARRLLRSRHRWWWLFAVLVAPLALALDWQVEVTPAGELYPVLQWSASAGGDGLVAVVVNGVAAGTRLRAQLRTPGLREPAQASALAGGGEVVLRLPLRWDATALREVEAVRTQRLQVQLEVGDTTLQREVVVRLHPLDEAAYFIRDSGVRVDLSWIFAAYVDPYDPAIDALLAQAREFDPAFERADADAARQARRRLRALWHVLNARGVRYDPGDPALARGPSVWSQRVRSAGQVLRERRANCIDGSVLIASWLERLGLHARIALVPGHAFVGYEVPGTPGTQFLETTLLGHADLDAALRAGATRWRKAARRLDGRHAPDYALIDVGTARAYGIIPLGAALRANP